jgi:hypothetical protein
MIRLGKKVEEDDGTHWQDQASKGRANEKMKKGKDLPPCLLGYFPYKLMGWKVNKTMEGE